MLFYDYLARMGCAFVMGTLIGIERQYRQRNAGLRTNILVSVGAAAFTVLSCDMMEKPRDFDPFGQTGLSPLATI